MSAPSHHPLLVALLSGPHTVDARHLSLEFDPLQPGADVLAQVDQRLMGAVEASQRDLEAECTAVDTLLAWAGIDPASCRTEGGAINLPRLRALLADAPASSDGGTLEESVLSDDDGALDCPFPDSVDALGSTDQDGCPQFVADATAADDSHGFFLGAPGAPVPPPASSADSRADSHADSRRITLERCGCRACRPVTLADMRMALCEQCGNKRCPHANDHRNPCTNSNEPGQPGSAYPAPSAAAADDPFELALKRAERGLPVADGCGYTLSQEPPEA